MTNTRSKKTCTVTLALAAALLSAVTARASTGKLPKVNIGRTPTYVYDNLVYLASACARDDYRIFAVLRVDTVVDVSAASVDRQAVERAGLHYVHLPVENGLGSDPERIASVLESLERADRNHRVLLHDHDHEGQEMNAIWALYRVSAGEDLEAALDEARAMGLRDRTLLNRVKRMASDR